jgi:hypothetical protein
MNGTVATFVIFGIFAGVIYAINLRESKLKDTPEYQQELIEERKSRLAESMKYIRDSTTGICFARMASGHGIGLATVDCEKLSDVPVIEFSSESK